MIIRRVVLLLAVLGFTAAAAAVDYKAMSHGELLRALFEVKSEGVVPKGHFEISKRELTIDVSGINISIPQFDPNPESRALALLTLQGEIQNYPLSYAYNGVTPLYYGRGPLPIPGSLAYTIITTQIIDFIARASPTNQNTLLAIGSFMPYATFDEIAAIFPALAQAPNPIPVPPSLDNWKDDLKFANMRLTYLGHNLKQLKKPLFPVVLATRQMKSFLGPSTTFLSLAREGKLYGSDFWEVGDYSQQEPGRYAPRVQVMFGPNAKKKFTVLAIKLGNGLVYTPFDTDGEWTLAKIAVNVAEMLWTSANHFLTTHLLLEPIGIEMIRHLSERHPVYQILNHAFLNMYGMNAAGFTTLFTNGTTLDLVSGWGARGYMYFYANHTADAIDFSATLEQSIKKRGLKGLSKYRQLVDTKLVVKAIRAFVHGFLKFYYKNDDSLVAGDFELQAWATACRDPSGAGVPNFPASFKKMRQVEDMMVHILYLAEVKHHAMNSRALWLGYASPTFFFALWKSLPTQKGVAVDPREYVTPTRQVLLGEMALALGFYRPIALTDTVTFAYGDNTGFGPVIDGIAAKYIKAMLAVDKAIEKREAKPQLVEFTLLKPSNIADYLLV